MYEDGASKERQVIPRIEAVPERTEQKHSQCAVTSFIDDVAQPQ